MTSLNNKLRTFQSAFAALEASIFHYYRTNKKPPYIIWAESGEGNSTHAGNHKVEQSVTGDLDLFTKTEFDPLVDQIQDTFDRIGAAWRLDDVAYEEDTNLIHYRWEWSVS